VTRKILSVYKNGNLREVADYSSGTLEGDMIHYDMDGELMVKLIYSADELMGYQYNVNGTLCDTIKITDGSQIVEAYYNNGQISFEKHYEDYVPEGKMVKYYSDGTVASIRNFHKGLLDGECKNYYPDGTLKKIFTCRAGLFQGDYTEYYENGNPKEKIAYKNDEEHGERVLYDENGKVKRIENYRSGEFNGLKSL
jgi:antitoxin component YwqK of YwqJK toxin-antitoxin module